MPIETLLSAPDNFELVRDQIAAILTAELAHQETLGLDPVPRVFRERARPWGPLVQVPPDERPIINVWFDAATVDGASSNTVERQKYDATYNIDCYAFATSRATVSGHLPSDEAAAVAAAATVRIARQILMAGPYTYLGMRGVVWRRWPLTVNMFQAPIDARPDRAIAAGRLALAVQFNEFSPQASGEPIESLHIDVQRKETGELYLAAHYGVPDP